MTDLIASNHMSMAFHSTVDQPCKYRFKDACMPLLSCGYTACMHAMESSQVFSHLIHFFCRLGEVGRSVFLRQKKFNLWSTVLELSLKQTPNGRKLTVQLHQILILMVSYQGYHHPL